MKYTDTRAVVETGFLTALIMVFTFVGVTVPFMGFLASILMPAVLVVLGARHGVRWSILATVTMGLVMSVVLSPCTYAGHDIRYSGYCFSLRLYTSLVDESPLGIAGRYDDDYHRHTALGSSVRNADGYCYNVAEFSAGNID